MSGCRAVGGKTVQENRDASDDFLAFLQSVNGGESLLPGQTTQMEGKQANRSECDLPDDSGPSRLVFPTLGPPPVQMDSAGSVPLTRNEPLGEDSGPSRLIFPSNDWSSGQAHKSSSGQDVGAEPSVAGSRAGDNILLGVKTESEEEGNMEGNSTPSTSHGTEEAWSKEEKTEEQKEWKLPSYDALLKEEEEENTKEEEEEEQSPFREEGNSKDADLDEAFSAFMNEVDSLPKAPKAGVGVSRQTVPAAASVVQSLGTGEQQVIRLTSQFFPSPWQTLLLSPEATEEQIKKQFRKISLLIHPDKCKHPKANEAFQILTKANEELQKPEMAERYKKVIEEAKARVMKQREKENKRRCLEKEAPLVDDDAKLQQEIAEMCEKMLKEKDENRQYAEECLRGNERYEKEKELREKEEEERVAKERQDFRKGQEGRVTSWRTFKTDIQDKSVKLLAFQGVRHVREQRKDIPGQASSLKRKRPVGIDESYKDNWR